MSWHWPIFPQGCPCSTVGATTFHDRVRDGNGWFHRALWHQDMVRTLCSRESRPRGGPVSGPAGRGRRLHGKTKTKMKTLHETREGNESASHSAT